MFYLQSRWKLEGNMLVYYGLRSKPNLFKNKIKLRPEQAEIIGRLPCKLDNLQQHKLGALLGIQVVLRDKLKAVPKSLDDAVFCSGCAANDYIIPGIEFDEEGFCPMCQTKKETAGLKSILPVMNTFPKSEKSRFDVALFYTGGKDSTYLLYYLSKVQKLRVLALTWEIPYMSESAVRSIENARKKFDNVEFISRRICNDDLRKIYRKLYELSGNTCACPSLAYVLFYPELVVNKVPYFIAGNEPAQLTGLYYNHIAPEFAYNFHNNKPLNILFNAGRVITLHPPLKKGQFHTLAAMKQLAYGNNFIQRMTGYTNPLVTNIVEAIHTVPEMMKPLKRELRRSFFSGNIPAFVQVDMDEICGGKYDWKRVREIISEECGWIAPEECEKGLHTSCNVEKCKEYSQFVRFYNMESTMIPFSALEISLASRDGNISREQAVEEMKCSLGFSLDEIPECSVMKEYFLI